MKTLGRHLILELYGCERSRLTGVGEIEAHMLRAAELIGATVMGHAFHRFRPEGVSGAVVIAESHLAIHTWPEHDYVAVDVYACGGLDPRPACDHLAEVFGARRRRMQEILRGVPDELAAEGVLEPADVRVESRWLSAPE